MTEATTTKTETTKPITNKTTAILGIHPDHSEQQIDVRYLGYVQGVQSEADQAIITCQKEASEPVGKAGKERDTKLAEARVARAAAEKAAEDKYQLVIKAAKAKRQSRLDKAKNAFERTRVEVREAFSAVADPAAEKLKIQLAAIQNDLRIKLTNASKEHSEAFKIAQAKRLEAEAAEKARKEAEEAMKANIEAEKAKARNENGEATVVPTAA